MGDFVNVWVTFLESGEGWVFLLEDLPVKLWPKTSSSGGRHCLGVVHLVIVNAWAFRSGSFAIASSCCCMLLDHRWDCHWIACRGGLWDLEALRQGRNAHNDFECTIIGGVGTKVDRDRKGLMDKYPI